MNPQPESMFFAMLSLLCWAATIVVIGLAIAARKRPDSGAAGWIATIADSCLWLGFVVAAVTMGGSLYYSQIVHDTPCELCWFQRICEYPLAVVLLIAALRKDREIWRYVVVPAAIGILIAIYHTQLQAFPKQKTFCQILNPCTTRYVWQFGFVSLPFMDLAALTFVLTMMFVARSSATNLLEGDQA